MKRRKAGRTRIRKRRQVRLRPVSAVSEDKTLRETETKFPSLVEGTSVAIGVTNLAGNFTYVNKALADLTGYTTQELIGRAFIEFLHPEDRERILSAFTEGLSRPKEVSEIEFRVVRKDGSVLHLLSKPTRVVINGETLGFQAMIVDISARKRADEKLIALHRHSLQLSTASSIDEIVGYTLDTMEHTLGFHYANFDMIENDALHVKGTRGVPTSPRALPLDGPGVIVKAVKTKKSIRLADTRTEPAFVELGVKTPEGRPLHMLSELAVPIVVDGSSVGVLNAESAELEAFNETDQILLETLAMHIASAVSRMQQMETLRRRAEQLGALESTVLDITSRRDLQTLLYTIVRRAAELLDAHEGGMYLCDTERREVRCVVSYNTPDDYTGRVLKYGEGAAGTVAETGEPVIIDDYRTWSGRAAAYETEKPFSAVMSVPMIWEGQVIGVLHVLGESKIRHFTESDKELLAVFANHAAIAVENTRLLEGLSGSVSLLRATLESTADGILVVDRKGRASAFNSRFAELWGIPEAVLETKDSVRLRQFVADQLEDPEQFLEKTQELYSEPERESFDVLRFKNGRVFERYSLPQRVGEEIVGRVWSFRDVTGRKRMEEELHRHSEHLQELVAERTSKLAESESRFRELADLLPQLVYEADLDGSFTFLNRAGLEATGYSDADLQQGLNAFQLIIPEDRDRARESIERVLTGGRSLGKGYRLQRKDGITFPVITYSAPIVREGKPVGLRGIVLDITERERAENALRESETQLRLMADSFPAIIAYIDAQEHYRLNNKAYQEWFGRPLKEITGRHIREVLGEQTYRKIRPYIQSVLSGHEISYEDELPYQSGGTRYISATYVPHFGEGGQVKGFFSLVIDITEQKRMEARLAESERLATIGETTAMVGHDLRNPLQAIVGTLYLLRRLYETIPEDLKKRAAEYGAVDMFGTIEESVRYMDKIVSDLRDYAGPLKLEITSVSVGHLLNESLSTIRVPSDVKVLTAIPDDSPKLMVDSDMMKRVFTNLILNAIQAMPNGGQLMMGVSMRERNLLISFQDTGVGIPRENQPKLFSPLFTTKAKGQGLGLAVCKRLVEAHGGNITFDSTAGKGSTFTVALPLSENEER